MQPDPPLAEPTLSPEQPPPTGRNVALSLLSVALLALWTLPLGILTFWPGVEWVQPIYVSLVSGLAVALAVWTVHGPGRLVVRGVESVAGAIALLWCSYSVLELLGFAEPIRQELAGFLAAWWGTVWLVSALLLGLLHFVGMRHLSPPPEVNAPTAMQFSLYELLRLTALVAVLLAIVTRAAAIPFVDGWFTGWVMSLFAPMLLLMFGNILPILVGGGLAIWTACRPGYLPLGVLLALATAVVYAVILNSFGPPAGAAELLPAGVVFFAFTWCGARLIYVCKGCEADSAC